MKLSRITYVVGLALLASANVWAQSGNYKIIVNSANTEESISKSSLARIFLKKDTRFLDGHGASPVDLTLNSPVREIFSRNVFGKSTSDVDALWQEQIFSGKDIPPPQKNEKAAIEYVRSNANGIAYVSADADTKGLKVLRVQ
ncbi:MAG TPA: hypothetical protein VKV95_11730 [Terriglobia bacterium]|nr:hypothetical protein [Terriglobia bacterium]